MREHGAALAHAAAPEDWVRTLTAVAAVLPADEPVILVLDEGHLSAKPVLLLLLGSDLAMMDRLTSYDHPFYGRANTRWGR